MRPVFREGGECRVSEIRVVAGEGYRPCVRPVSIFRDFAVDTVGSVMFCCFWCVAKQVGVDEC